MCSSRFEFKEHIGMNIRILRIVASATICATLAATSMAADKVDSGKDNTPVVALVNGKEIRLSTLIALQQSHPQLRQQPLEANYEKILENTIIASLVLDQAKTAKMESDPIVKKQVQEAQNEIMQQAWIRKKVESDITEAAIKSRFDEVVKNWQPREEVRARHILVETEDAAKAVISDLKAGISFEDEAKAKSKDPSAKKSGGDIGYIAKDEGVVPEFAEAAFKLKSGEVTQTPVKTQFGWHIIKAEDRRMAPPPTFEEAHDTLRSQLAQEDIQKIVGNLQKSATIKRFKPDGSPLTAATEK